MLSSVNTTARSVRFYAAQMKVASRNSIQQEDAYLAVRAMAQWPTCTTRPDTRTAVTIGECKGLTADVAAAEGVLGARVASGAARAAAIEVPRITADGQRLAGVVVQTRVRCRAA